MTVPTQLLTDIEHSLKSSLGDISLHVIDHTHKHLKHASHQAGLFHLELQIQAPHLASCGRLKKDRMVYQALAEWLPSQIHSLIITWT